MASTYSNLKIELIGTGEQSGTWGATTNTNLGTALEEAIVGSANVAFSSADITLTLTNSNLTQSARHLRLNLTGTSGGARNLILGSGCQIDKPYIINNGLADTVTVKNTTGTGVAVPSGKSMWVFNNGTNVVDVVTHVNATVTGNVTGNLTGNVTGNVTGNASTATTISGTVAIANGGTGATDAGTARTNLGLGSIATQAANNVSITGGSITGITDLAVADGGTGASSFTANNVLLGNGTSAFQTVAPGSNGNALVSNGTTWTSAAIPAPAALSTASGSAPSYSARAWVNFNGTTNVGGNCTVRASGNVSSVTDNGTGDYTVNFTTAMQDADYTVVGSVGFSSGAIIFRAMPDGVLPTTSSCRVIVIQTNFNLFDSAYVMINFFR